MAAQNWSLKQVLDQLNSGNLWSNNQITYSFPTSASDMYTGSGEAGGFKALSTVQITFAEYALSGWDDLILNDFVKGNGSTNIEIANTTTGIDYAHAYYPKTGSVWFNPEYSDVKNPVIGDYGFGTFIHEIGHALGLDHMGEYNGNGSWAPSSYQDSTVLSIMSYFGPDHGDSGKNSIMWADWVKNGTTYSAQTPMLNDVMAIQAMYGVETTTRTGATTYGFNSNITGSAGKIFDFDLNENPILCIFDSSGNDTLDLSGFSTKSSISLVAGSFSDCNQMTNNISIAYTATIENAIGGAGDDTITGNSVANILTGGRGNDHIDGAGGNDIAVFFGAYANYTITALGNGSYAVTDNVGTDGTDTLTSIETLRFSDRDVSGSGGTDTGTAPTLVSSLLDQSADTDTLFSFVIPGSAFTDPDGDALTYTATLQGGGSLPDWLTFDATTRTFSGTPGTADIATLSIVVTASDGSESASDTFVLEIGGDGGTMLLGSRFNDKLSGTSDDEIIRGFAGRDRIYAGAGDDHIDGGKGRDTLWGQDGADIFAFTGKNGMDDIADFSFADGDRIDLSGVKGITSYADLMNNHFFSLDGEAYIRISKGHDILLLGVDANAMTEANFIF